MTRHLIKRNDGIDLTNMYRLKNKSHKPSALSVYFCFVPYLVRPSENQSVFLLRRFYKQIHFEFLDQKPKRGLSYRRYLGHILDYTIVYKIDHGWTLVLE